MTSDMLRKQFNEELGIADERALKVLWIILEEAKSFQANYDKEFGATMTLTEFKTMLESIRNALVKIRDEKGTEAVAYASLRRAMAVYPPMERRVLDIASEWLRDRRTTLGPKLWAFEVTVDQLPTLPTEQRSQTIELLLVPVDKMIQESLQPGRGNRKSNVRRYREGIRYLGEVFADECPGHEVSANRSSVFYRYVSFWLTHIVKSEVQVPARHIQAVIRYNKALIRL